MPSHAEDSRRAQALSKQPYKATSGGTYRGWMLGAEARRESCAWGGRDCENSNEGDGGAHHARARSARGQEPIHAQALLSNRWQEPRTEAFPTRLWGGVPPTGFP